MPPKGIKYIPLKESVYEAIKLRKHHGQSFNGVVEDLLESLDSSLTELAIAKLKIEELQGKND